MTVSSAVSPPFDLGKTLASLARYIPQTDKIDNFSAKLGERPAQNTLMIVGAGALLFFLAERNCNPRVKTIYDALEYCSSSLSVGYSSIFPMSALGKVVASFIMTYGPALSGAILEGPKKPEGSDAETQQKILATLEAILQQIRSQPPQLPLQQ